MCGQIKTWEWVLTKNQFLHGIGYKATPWAKIMGDHCLLTGQAKLNSELDVGSVRLSLVYTTVVQVNYIWRNTDYSSPCKTIILFIMTDSYL